MVPAGLTSAEADRRLAHDGPNALPPPPRRSIASRVLAQLRDPMIMLLLAAVAVTIAIGDVTDTAVIGAVIILNTTIGVLQEVRAEQAIAALHRLAAPRARVRRDGSVVDLPASDVVRGDVMHLDAGDVVPADGVLAQANRLLLDESTMTGESMPVDREPAAEVLAGTVVTRGRAVATVTRTGLDSGLGRIAALIAATPVTPTPLQRRLSQLSRLLVVVTLGLCGLVLGLGLLQGRDVLDMLVVAVSLAVAAVPESLPAVVSVALALGAYRMARRSAIVRRLPAVETLGSVTVIASDKTGTLTEGRMVAGRVWTPERQYVVSGTGYAPEGRIMPDCSGDDHMSAMLRDIALCGDAVVRPPDDGGDWVPVGDPLEAALNTLALKGGVDPDDVRRRWPRAAEIPFDSHRRRMTTLHAAPDGGWLAVCKGAPEVILDQVGSDHDPDAGSARTAADALAADGYRVIAVATAWHRTRPDDAQLEDGLHAVGLVAVADPPRSTAHEVVDACRAAGIRLVLVTGDHSDTAKSIATLVGIGGDDAPEVADGTAVIRGDHEDRVERIGVYARIHPEQKVDIVAAWQQRGAVVAMTGDGVNDAPALRAADIGVAMGKGGTEVARQAADLVLADDDLRTVVAAVEEGRRIFTNIHSFLRYALSGGFAEIVVMLLAPFLGMPVPLVPAQILWINMLTHGLPGVAFGGEPLDPAVMREPSRSPRESVLGAGLAAQIAVAGSLIATAALAAGVWADATGEHVQSWIFTVLGLAQLGVAVALRSPVRHAGLWSRGLDVAVAAAAVLQFAGVYAPPLQALLGTEAIAGWTLVALALLAAVPGTVVRLTRPTTARRLARRRGRSGPRVPDSGRPAL
ncbi:MAG TPA: cation-translocating P-type ATPase [Nocardioidaceae bacterium]|nr:cation-translocating P-type ATPase [Nocardioidaceae bacterium]